MKKNLLWIWGLLLCACVSHAVDRKLTVAVSVPDTAWKIRIDRVVQVEDELWVISTLSREEGMMGAMMITTAQDSVNIEARDLPVKHFILGKTWKWKNKEPVKFLKDLQPVSKELEAGKQLYRKAEPER